MNKKKARLRLFALTRRRNLSQKEIQEKSERIWENLLQIPWFEKARLVLFYIALPDEVQTQGMIKAQFKRGKRVAVPVVQVDNRRIVPVEIKSPQLELVPGPFGVLQPKKEDRYSISLTEIDLVIVPGVAFDIQGRRLGFGAGFYDRFLPKLPSSTLFIAPAFECQLIDEIPCEKYDVSMDYLVTERRIIPCYKNKKGG